MEGLPARELTDEELERQGTHAHALRNWVFLHGTAEQYQRHTERMLELEQEYLRRHPKRTWQGAGGDPEQVDEATRLRLALRSLQRQIDAILAEGGDARPEDEADPQRVRQLLDRVAANGGRMHKLELHQAARELGVGPIALARLYRGEKAVLRTERDQRVLLRDA
ncbi:MAG: DUF6158 family protein [Mycobacteriales bacterium]